MGTAIELGQELVADGWSNHHRTEYWAVGEFDSNELSSYVGNLLVGPPAAELEGVGEAIYVEHWKSQDNIGGVTYHQLFNKTFSTEPYTLHLRELAEGSQLRLRSTTTDSSELTLSTLTFQPRTRLTGFVAAPDESQSRVLRDISKVDQIEQISEDGSKIFTEFNLLSVAKTPPDRRKATIYLGEIVPNLIGRKIPQYVKPTVGAYCVHCETS